MKMIKNLFKNKRPTIMITTSQLRGLLHYMEEFYGVDEMKFDLFKFRKIVKIFGLQKAEIYWAEEAKKRSFSLPLDKR